MLRRLLGMAPRGPLAVRLRRFAIVGVRTAEWTYIRNAETGAEELYHRPSDPDQQTDRRAYAYGLLKTSLVRGSAIPLQLGLLYGFRRLLQLGPARAALIDQYAFVTVTFGIPVADQIVLLANLFAIPISGLYRYIFDARWTWG